MITTNAFSQDPTSHATILIDGDEVRNLTSWVASQDVLMIGDPFSVTVPNPRGVWTKKLKVGAQVKLYLQNPGVQGNRATLTHTGIVVERTVSGDNRSGSVIRLQCADKGWHLTNNCPPFYKNGSPQLIEKTTLNSMRPASRILSEARE